MKLMTPTHQLLEADEANRAWLAKEVEADEADTTNQPLTRYRDSDLQMWKRMRKLILMLMLRPLLTPKQPFWWVVCVQAFHKWLPLISCSKLQPLPEAFTSLIFRHHYICGWRNPLYSMSVEHRSCSQFSTPHCTRVWMQKQMYIVWETVSRHFSLYLPTGDILINEYCAPVYRSTTCSKYCFIDENFKAHRPLNLYLCGLWDWYWMVLSFFCFSVFRFGTSLTKNLYTT